jgi:hypothetical protein
MPGIRARVAHRVVSYSTAVSRFAEPHARSACNKGPLFIVLASLHHRRDAFDDDGVQRLGRRRAWVEPLSAALALEKCDVFVGHLDVALALPRLQRVRLGMPVEDNASARTN